MVRRVFLVACAFLLLVAQGVLGPSLAIGFVAPDFYLLFVVYLVGLLSPSRALVSAWALGLLRDSWTAAPLGVDACALLAAAGLLVWANRRFVLDTDVARALLAFLAGLVHGAVWAVALHAATPYVGFWSLFVRIGLPAAAYSAVLMPLFGRAMTASMRRLPGGEPALQLI